MKRALYYGSLLVLGVNAIAYILKIVLFQQEQMRVAYGLLSLACIGYLVYYQRSAKQR